MIKVYLEAGLAGRLESVCGERLSEDERFLRLRDGPIIRYIPHSRIVHIEDLSMVIGREGDEVTQDEQVQEREPERVVHSAAKLQPELQPDPQPEHKEEPVTHRPIRDLNQLRDRMAEAARSRRNDDLTTFAPPVEEDLIPLNVVITGSLDASLTVSVPQKAIVPNQFTPSLAKALSKSLELSAILETGIVYDGKPTVIGTNVYIRTKNIAESTAEMVGKVNAFAKVAEMTTKFVRPPGNYQTDFAMGSKTGGAIPHSPFDRPVMLGGDENEDSTNESGPSEESPGQEVQEGNGEVLEESAAD